MRKIELFSLLFIITIFCISCESSTESEKLTIEKITNLIGYWALNGNANDSSSNQNHGVVNGATPGDDRFGNENSAYYFDGVDDYITIKEADGFESFDDPETIFTFSAWCLITEKLTGYIFSNASEDGWLDIRLIHSRPSFGIRDSEWTGTVLNSPDTISTDEWHHVVGIFNNPDMTIYVDGQNKGTTPFVGEILSFGGLNNAGIRIGAYYLLDGFLFKGGIDDIRVYNRNLTEGEVLLLYNEE